MDGYSGAAVAAATVVAGYLILVGIGVVLSLIGVLVQVHGTGGESMRGWQPPDRERNRAAWRARARARAVK